MNKNQLSKRFFEFQKSLEKPLVFFDIESTGINPRKDRIIEISIIKITKDEICEPIVLRINPGIPITNESSKIHGIYDEDVKNLPTFKFFAKQIWDLFDNSDYAGYNITMFDIPILQSEFNRCGFECDLSKGNIVDPFVIFKTKIKFDLSTASDFFLGKKLINAHDALADTIATIEVLSCQLEKYVDLSPNVEGICISKMKEETKKKKEKRKKDKKKKERLVIQEGVYYMNFGRHKGKKISDTPRDYLEWILKAEDEFPEDVKEVVRHHLKKMA